MNPSGTQSSISDEFLRIASDAINNSQSGEGALRSAISRAYYAVFLTVRDQLFGPDGRHLPPNKRKRLQRQFKMKLGSKSYLGSHDLIIYAITAVPHSSTLRPVTLSQQVTLLKKARIHADYDFTLENLQTISKQNWREYAEDNVQLATHLLRESRKLPPY